ncbi:MAG TPA: helix-turn-helix domain-containing protein [Longimicrobiaceae bacterium]|nr:helix-turn-helix domain-containing protein [Longimicrobiaceae bacterium]
METSDQDRIEVTKENFGDLLIQGLEEVLAIRRGEKEPARTVVRTTVREVVVEPPRSYRAEAIRQIRERMGLSQAVFAKVLNSSAETVKAWEQGKRAPDGMALALLQVAEDHPKVLLDRVKEAGRRGRR